MEWLYYILGNSTYAHCIVSALIILLNLINVSDKLRKMSVSPTFFQLLNNLMISQNEKIVYFSIKWIQEYIYMSDSSETAEFLENNPKVASCESDLRAGGSGSRNPPQTECPDGSAPSRPIAGPRRPDSRPVQRVSRSQ